MNTMGKTATTSQSPRDPPEQPGVPRGGPLQTPLPGDRAGIPVIQDALHSSSFCPTEPECEPQEQFILMCYSTQHLQNVTISIHLPIEVVNEKFSFLACPIFGC